MIAKTSGLLMTSAIPSPAEPNDPRARDALFPASCLAWEKDVGPEGLLGAGRTDTCTGQCASTSASRSAGARESAGVRHAAIELGCALNHLLQSASHGSIADDLIRRRGVERCPLLTVRARQFPGPKGCSNHPEKWAQGCIQTIATQTMVIAAPPCGTPTTKHTPLQTGPSNNGIEQELPNRARAIPQICSSQYWRALAADIGGIT